MSMSGRPKQMRHGCLGLIKNMSKLRQWVKVLLKYGIKLPVTHASCGFKWTAIWPLMGIAITDDNKLKAFEYAKMLLEPKQKRLPEALTAALKKAIVHWETGQNDKASIAFKESLQLAREMAYV